MLKLPCLAAGDPKGGCSQQRISHELRALDHQQRVKEDVPQLMLAVGEAVHAVRAGGPDQMWLRLERHVEEL